MESVTACLYICLDAGLKDTRLLGVALRIVCETLVGLELRANGHRDAYLSRQSRLWLPISLSPYSLEPVTGSPSTSPVPELHCPSPSSFLLYNPDIFCCMTCLSVLGSFITPLSLLFSSFDAPPHFSSHGPVQSGPSQMPLAVLSDIFTINVSTMPRRVMFSLIFIHTQAHA